MGAATTSASSSHKSAEFIQKEYRFSDMGGVEADDTKFCSIWGSRNKVNQLEWGSEADLVGHVKSVLHDVIDLLGYEQNINFKQELAFFDNQRIDILLVCVAGIPIGVVEVKRPGSTGNSSLDNPNNIGQMFDYLTHLGRHAAFGFLTSYSEWRIMWLPDADSTDERSTKHVANPDVQIPSECPNWSQDGPKMPFIETDEDQSSDLSMGNRKVCGTRIIKWNDPYLVCHLIDAVQKMIFSPVHPLSLPSVSDTERHYIYVTENDWQWKPLCEKILRVSNVIPRFQSIFLIADLGGGGDGRVWLAATRKGDVCVIKFSNNKKMLSKEAEIWNIAWQCDVTIKQLNGRSALVMPWVKPCTDEEFRDDKVQIAIKKAINTLAEAGYQHDDLHQRHIGLYRRNSKYGAVLFDLARVSEKSDEQKSITEMMKSLQIV